MSSIYMYRQELHSKLSCQPCGDVLSLKDRRLVDHGNLKLLDSRVRPPREVDVFLFTDLLLLTQQTSTHRDKRISKKEVCLQSAASNHTQPQLQPRKSLSQCPSISTICSSSLCECMCLGQSPCESEVRLKFILIFNKRRETVICFEGALTDEGGL